MKYLAPILLSLFIVFSTYGQTVTYLSNGDNLQSAIDAGTAGDTFIIGAGNYSGNIVITKRVTLIGPGYLNSGGPSAEATLTGTFSLNAGSENSLITGLSFTDNVYLACSDIVFKRNTTVSSFFYLARTSASATQLSISNIQVIENFIRNSSGLYVYGAPITNYVFQNNLIQGDLFLSNNAASNGSFINNTLGIGTISSQGDGITVSSNSSGVNISFINNIFTKALNTVTGNIFSSINYVPVVFKYNVLINADTDFSVTPPANNSFGNLVADLFAGFPLNAAGLALDEQYILSATSPAKDFGREAPYTDTDPTTDAGAFGGENPYILSGIPVGPYIYKSTVPPIAATNSVIPVTVKAKSNN